MKMQARGRTDLSAWLRRIWIRQTDVVLAMLVTLAGLAFFAFSGIGGNTHAGFVFLQNIEQRSLDLRFGMRGERPHDSRIVIVGIDEKTLQKIGSFPLPRNSYALLIKQLDAGGAGVIAFDETFPTPASNSAMDALEELRREAGKSASPPILEKINQLESGSDQDANLAAALKSGGNVVLGHVFLGPGNLEATDAKVAADYYNIVWAQSFPQVVPVKAKDGRSFDLGKAWIDNGGVVEAAVEPNIVKLAQAAASYGFINIRPDPDGTLRHALLIVRYQDQDFFPSLALQIVREYEKIPDQNIAAYIAEDGLERIQLGTHELRPSRDGTALINYAGPYGTYAHYSMWDVMSGATPPEAFRGKIVLVGGTALAIGDMRNTPYEGATYMGVEVHANIIDNVLHSGEKGRGFLQRGLDEEMIDVGVILIFGIGFGLLFGRVQPLYSTLLLLAALGVFVWFVYWAFAAQGRWLSFVIPAGTLVANYAAITSFRMIFEEREKRRIRKMFSRYLSPDVIALIEKDPQKYIRPGGEMKELTVMFSDIRGFTTLSEGLTPDELVLLLNEYLGEMTEAVFGDRGTLDKYIGDAVMAFWGSPLPQEDHAVRGCSCALQMQRRLEKLNIRWKTEGRPHIAIGIGLNTGPMTVGNMGSAHFLNWTVMGDNVNLASRLEGITKTYRIGAVISEATYQEVASQFTCRELDRITVKGKSHAVKIYELMGTAAERAKFEPLLKPFDEAMAAYLRQDWRGAAAGFGELLGSYPEDGPTQVFLQRALEFMENAPEPDWNGVYVMKTK
ncbi:MAG TPA: adenylate/guanylate cyclase domain-containing protein [Candidatus Acidoferrales bacterium]|jgi:adenylate cyclase|nr:adenylate/guanylate cyclase domain-containing protein [Candidatus Acidoferrales bacterium]